jgi:hypothetical protein
MCASIRRYKVDSKSVGEAFRQANEGFVPTISKVPGFVEMVWMRETERW